MGDLCEDAIIFKARGKNIIKNRTKYSNSRRKINEDPLTMDEVEDALNKIDTKYSKYTDDTKLCDTNLVMLLQDFDALGLPEIDISLPIDDINRKVVKNSKLLVEMYRRNINELDEDKLNSKYKDNRYADLQKKLTIVKSNYDKLDYKTKSLEAIIVKMKSDNSKMNEIVVAQRSEIKKLKQYYTSKQDELQHSIRKLEKNNKDLKEMFGQDVGKYISKDDAVANYVKKCKLNEQIHEATIKQLQENNSKLMEQLAEMREK